MSPKKPFGFGTKEVAIISAGADGPGWSASGCRGCLCCLAVLVVPSGADRVAVCPSLGLRIVVVCGLTTATDCDPQGKRLVEQQHANPTSAPTGGPGTTPARFAWTHLAIARFTYVVSDTVDRVFTTSPAASSGPSSVWPRMQNDTGLIVLRRIGPQLPVSPFGDFPFPERLEVAILFLADFHGCRSLADFVFHVVDSYTRSP
ncbi:uncharacterized protein LOC122626087 [Drosophila teissieri]|uniref:uncharacterized protein LOC122626087 n=1 Tax=Drosophila teissieri TaxID=7243 RepID=UPI001CBA585C|nr:uncharacterized protein LOC122626087 [Drosophila teissieri]XP_043662147.1 uncharacterized protein LOC122626087 [Drosophila teissieri]